MADQPQYRRIDTAGVPLRDQFEAWQVWHNDVVGARMRLRAPATESGFAARAEALRAAEIRLVEVASAPAMGVWDRPPTPDTDRFRVTLIGPTQHGLARFGPRLLPLAAGMVTVSGHDPGAWQAPAGVHGIQVSAPRAVAGLTDVELDRLIVGTPAAPGLVMDTLIRPGLSGLFGHLGALQGADPSRLSDHWIAMLRLLIHSLAGRDLNAGEHAAARRHLLEQYIQAHLAEPDLSPARITGALGIGRRTLYATLATAGEPGVAAFIRARRLRAAFAMLASRDRPRMPVHAVAAAVGIPDPTRFGKLFRAAYGCTPRDLRTSVVAQPGRGPG